jgi:hypothetical protein
MRRKEKTMYIVGISRAFGKDLSRIRYDRPRFDDETQAREHLIKRLAKKPVGTMGEVAEVRGVEEEYVRQVCEVQAMGVVVSG